MAGCRRAVCLLTVMLLAAHAAAAQRVRGTIRDGLSGQPVSGAVVWVSDSAGVLLARSIGNETGSYAVPRLPRSARLHVLRIGFRPRDIALDVSPANARADTVIDVDMATVPLSLQRVEAESRRVCPGDRGTGAALELWEQARAALLASVVSREAGAPAVRVVSFERTYEPISHQLLGQTVRARRLVADRSYVAARAPWAFAEYGYMREERNGDRIFYAPDDVVLLDPTFADTHCLHVIDGRGPRAGETGIAFEPVHTQGRDTLVDVTGVLWLDRGSTALHSIEFRYTDMEPAARGSGGEIFFSVMPNGAPMIDHWIIRSTVLAEDIPLHPSPVRRRPPDRARRFDVSITQYRESGGAVAVATWPNGASWRSPLLFTVRGELMQLNGVPAAGARVWLRDGPDTTVSDANGRFTFEDLYPGRYSVMAADSLLASVGVARGWGAVHVGADVVSHPFLYYLGQGDALAVACRGQPRPPGTGVVLGRVVTAGGAAEGSAHVDAMPSTASQNVSSAKSKPAFSTDVDDDGRFAICGVPFDQRLTLTTTSDAGASTNEVEWKGPLAAITIVVR